MSRLGFLSTIAAAAALGAVSTAAATPCGESPVRFTNNLVASDYTYAYGIAVGDLDGDGDPDVTSADTTSDVFYWYENDGSGGLQRHIVKQNDGGWFERHAIADLNHDGAPDIVVIKILDNSIVWFENDGSPQNGGWAEHAIAPGTMYYAYDVAVSDLDADGDLDVAASSYAGNEFAWFENPGDPTIENWTKHVIARGEITLTMRVGDFNADGRPDLLASALETGLFWYENTGTPAAGWIEHRLMRGGRPSHGEPVDMDGDGDLDVIMAKGGAVSIRGGVSWFENRGNGRFSQRRIGRRMPGAFEAVAGDIDGDGDIDVATSSWSYPGGLVWFENRGDARRWCKRVVLDVWQNGNSVLLHDLDGDGRLDILSTAERGTNELRWWRNEGP